MATVTVFTAARMQEIEDTAITFAYLSGDDLILRRHNMATINVGSVRGPQGIQGPMGEVSNVAMAAAIASERSTGKPLNVAWGHVASAVATATQGSISTMVDLTSLTVTFTAVANRRYKISGNVLFQCGTVNASAGLIVATGANSQLQRRDTGSLSTISVPMGVHIEAYVAPGAGSVTYKLRAQRSAGSGDISMVSSSSIPAQLTVEDIGPV